MLKTRRAANSVLAYVRGPNITKPRAPSIPLLHPRGGQLAYRIPVSVLYMITMFENPDSNCAVQSHGV